MSEKNRVLLNIIIEAVKGALVEIIDSSKDEKVNFQYILGQSIRQWNIPSENWHTSKAALKLWALITDDEIRYRDYKETFTCKCQHSILVPTFRGTTRKFESVILKELTSKRIVRGKEKNDNKYVYNDIFITEHTTPVSDVILALKECYCHHKESDSRKSLLSKEFVTILNKIHKTQMLKIEDRRIKECQNRIALVKGNKELYEYIIDTESDKLFHDVIDKCYDTQIYDATDLTLSSKVETLKSESWAGALALDKPYKIEIIPNNPK